MTVDSGAWIVTSGKSFQAVRFGFMAGSVALVPSDWYLMFLILCSQRGRVDRFFSRTEPLRIGPDWIKPAMLPHLLYLYQAATFTGIPLKINKNLWECRQSTHPTVLKCWGSRCRRSPQPATAVESSRSRSFASAQNDNCRCQFGICIAANHLSNECKSLHGTAVHRWKLRV